MNGQERQQVGEFTWLPSGDGKTGGIQGPAAYMVDRGNALVDSISAGEDPAIRTIVHYCPDAILAVLIRLQNDYAAWLGSEQMKRWIQSA